MFQHHRGFQNPRMSVQVCAAAWSRMLASSAILVCLTPSRSLTRTYCPRCQQHPAPVGRLFSGCSLYRFHLWLNSLVRQLYMSPSGPRSTRRRGPWRVRRNYLITNVANDDSISIVFNSSNGLVGLAKAGKLPVGRQVTIGVAQSVSRPL